MTRGNGGRTRAILHISASALKAWWDDDALRLGASLAYYTLFAIAPVLLVATGIAGLVFNTEADRGEIVNQLDHLVGPRGCACRTEPQRMPTRMRCLVRNRRALMSIRKGWKTDDET
jgi:Virulence factor BrkB